MTGNHIRLKQDGEWEYPDHEELRKKYCLETIETYIGRKRHTLFTYLENNKNNLLIEVKTLTKPPRDPHKILWWQQKLENET